jgi:hypothetical protein
MCPDGQPEIPLQDISHTASSETESSSLVDNAQDTRNPYLDNQANPPIRATATPPPANGVPRRSSQQDRCEKGALKRAFLYALGLKILLSIGTKSSDDEKPKRVLTASRGLATVRTLTHLVPVLITVFLFMLNGFKLLNGPNIVPVATFFLQVAAKVHEIFIVGEFFFCCNFPSRA